MNIVQIKTLLDLQDRLNNNTAGTNWKKGIASNGKKIYWDICILTECAEILESTTYKHWKDVSRQPDIENIKIEIVDILHFILSSYLERYDIKVVIDILVNSESRVMDKMVYSDDDTIKTTKALMYCVLYDFNYMFSTFKYLVANIPDFTMLDVYNLYIGKNVLNQFRQDNGYKEGKYVKQWKDMNNSNIVEDNVILQSIMKDMATVTYDELYKELSNHYEFTLLSLNLID